MRPTIIKISFYIDPSTCNLREDIYYSDKSKSINYYHLISKLSRLAKHKNIALFDLDLK